MSNRSAAPSPSPTSRRPWRVSLSLPSVRPPYRGAWRWARRWFPTWLLAPWRRVIQAAAMALFLVLCLYVCWPYGGADYQHTLAAKERIEAETFLALDPLVSIATALAARMWVWSLVWAGVLLAVCLAIPRGFCGYLCPLGTTIDLFDWLVGKRAARFHVKERGGRGWWVHLKYYLLAGTLAAALCGITLGGLVAAIPIVTRGVVFLFNGLQTGLLRDWYQVPPMGAGQVVSLSLFAVVLLLGLLGPRFWCRYVCPTGAVFSVTNFLRLSQRKVTPSCTSCGQCVKVCPFDAIRPADFATRTSDCTLCQTCAGACPVEAIKFVDRWQVVGLVDQRPCPPGRREAGGLRFEAQTSSLKSQVFPGRANLSRRGFVVGVATGLAAAGGVMLDARRTSAMYSASASGMGVPVRPPGSVPEVDFLRLCIRCDLCIKACPNNVLQPMGLEHGFDALWTPQVVAAWSGCEPTCNNCGQVCPTGAIRALPVEEKRAARMGLAVVDPATCLPHAGQQACQLCVDACAAAGYHAIEFVITGTQVDVEGMPIEDSGLRSPSILASACVGCGLCETRCQAINVKTRHVLKQSAIRVSAGPGREDRLRHGSYRQLRQSEANPSTQGASTYLPDFLDR